MKIVMLSGQQGSGKTTVQKHLINYLGQRGFYATSVNFADIIYEMHDSVLDILNKHWPKRDMVKDGPLLQLLGTEWGRKTIDEEIWVKCLRNKIDKLKISNGYFIIGDCRFENEFDAFPDALRVRLFADEKVRKARCSMWRENTNHPSETGLCHYSSINKFDLYIPTDTVDADGCVNLIVAQLQKNTWAEKRK